MVQVCHSVGGGSEKEGHDSIQRHRSTERCELLRDHDGEVWGCGRHGVWGGPHHRSHYQARPSGTLAEHLLRALFYQVCCESSCSGGQHSMHSTCLACAPMSEMIFTCRLSIQCRTELKSWVEPSVFISLHRPAVLLCVHWQHMHMHAACRC